MWIAITAAFLLTTGAHADEFGDYWYQGKAEITSYTLSQARYGENRDGSAVMIFVTEDFSNSKHVKLDRPKQSPQDAVTVLKLNATRKFNTGIYPYSMMTSVFTPVSSDKFPNTLKVTTSSQEWCGHTFTQMNRTDTGYRARLFSYFEREGDRELVWKDGIPEDEIWVRIRLNPESLPEGSVRLIPSTIFQRLKHSAWGVHSAIATKTAHETNPDLSVYTIRYEGIDRLLAIVYQSTFPHAIESWEETSPSGFGPDAKRLTTTATRKHRIMSAYWQENDNAHGYRRKELGLE